MKKRDLKLNCGLTNCCERTIITSNYKQPGQPHNWSTELSELTANNDCNETQSLHSLINAFNGLKSVFRIYSFLHV